MEVETIDGVILIFYMWHNFYYDDGGRWYPKQEELDKAWFLKFVPDNRSTKTIMRDATWHTIYEGTHVYISKKGTFHGGRNKEEIKTEIRDGSWEHDPDLWMLI